MFFKQLLLHTGCKRKYVMRGQILRLFDHHDHPKRSAKFDTVPSDVSNLIGAKNLGLTCQLSETDSVDFFSYWTINVSCLS